MTQKLLPNSMDWDYTHFQLLHLHRGGSQKEDRHLRMMIKMSVVVNKTNLIFTPPPFFPSWCYLIFKWSFKLSNRVTSTRPCYPLVDSFTCTPESFTSDRYFLSVLRSSFLWLAAFPIKRQFRASWKCDTLASTYSSLTTPSHGMQPQHAIITSWILLFVEQVCHCLCVLSMP